MAGKLASSGLWARLLVLGGETHPMTLLGGFRIDK